MLVAEEGSECSEMGRRWVHTITGISDPLSVMAVALTYLMSLILIHARTVDEIY